MFTWLRRWLCWLLLPVPDIKDFSLGAMLKRRQMSPEKQQPEKQSKPSDRQTPTKPVRRLKPYKPTLPSSGA